MGPAARYAQLTYTAGRSGFGVQESLGGWTAGERSAVERKISVAAGFGPRWDSDDGHDLRRRCVWAPATDTAAALWHIVPAGRDASGRPGNIFAHCVLDRQPDRADEHRPISWWGSPDLLAPTGFRAVEKADLPPIPVPRPGTKISADSVIEYLNGQAESPRIDLALVLLDAVLDALGSGPPVVLGVENVEAAALWIGVLSFAMSRGAARRFHWSVLEVVGDRAGAGSLDAALARDLHLICIPRAMVRDVPVSADAVLLDEREPALLGSAGEAPHLDRRDREIPVSGWSTIFESVLGWTESGQILREMDALVPSVIDQDLDPRWPLAAYVAEHRDHHGDVAELAADVLIKYSPVGLAQAPRSLVQACQSLVAHTLGPSTAEAAEPLLAAARWTPAVDLVWPLYLQRAAADPQWFLRPEAPAVPTAGQWQAENEDVDRLIDLAWPRLPELDHQEHEVLVLRVIDHLVRIGSANATVEESLRSLVREVWPEGSLLGHDQAFVDRVGPLDPQTCRRVLRPALERATSLTAAPLGDGLSKPVGEWLFPDGVLDVVKARGVAATPLTVAAGVHARRSAAQAPSWLDDWLLAAWSPEHPLGQSAVAPGQVAPLLLEIYPDKVLPLEQLGKVMATHAPWADESFLCGSILAADPETLVHTVPRPRGPERKQATRAYWLAERAAPPARAAATLPEMRLICADAGMVLRDRALSLAQHIHSDTAGLILASALIHDMDRVAGATRGDQIVERWTPDLVHGINAARAVLAQLNAPGVEPPRIARFPMPALMAVTQVLAQPRRPALWLSPQTTIPYARLHDPQGRTLLELVIEDLGTSVFTKAMLEETRECLWGVAHLQGEPQGTERETDLCDVEDVMMAQIKDLTNGGIGARLRGVFRRDDSRERG